MKQLKRLLSLGLAMVLAFCTLSAGMVAHAEEEANPADSNIAFASLTVGGKSLDVSQGMEDFSILSYDKTTAKVSWTLNEGWQVTSAYSMKSDSSTSTNLENGGTVKVPKGGSVEIGIDANNGYYYRYYRVGIYTGKAKLLGGTVWLGSGESMPVCQGVSSGSEVLSIKSSNPEVLAAGKGDRLYSCVLLPKKAGSSKVTVVLNINGEKKTLKATYTVKKHPNAITSLKVNGKSVNLKKNKFYAMVKVNKDKTKVEYKIAKGWKAKCSYYDEAKGKHVTLKSGGWVPTKYYTGVMFTLTKGSDTFYYDVVLER